MNRGAILPPRSVGPVHLGKNMEICIYELPELEPCPFCEFLTGNAELGCAVVFADELTAAFINPGQIEVGHTLVVPNRHVPTILELTEPELGALSLATHKVARALHTAFKPDGMTLFQNNGVVSGQTVPHYHVHVVPRYKNGNWKGGAPPTITEPSPLESRLSEAARVTAAMQDHTA